MRIGSQTISVMYLFDGEAFTDIQDYALQRGFLLCVFSQDRAHWDVAAERVFLTRVKEEGHRGLLAFCSPLEPRNDDLLRELDAAGVRVIHIEHYRTWLPEQSYVLPDYRRAGHVAAVTLMMAGYEKLFYSGMSASGPFDKLLERGFSDALSEHAGGYDRERQYFEFPRIGQETDAQERLTNFAERLRGSSGVVCHGSGTARILAQALRERGLTVPEEVGVIGPRLIARSDVQESTDALEFDRAAILRRAIDEAANPSSAGVRELVAPTLVRRGTIRSRVVV